MILNRNQNVKDWTRYWPRLQSEKNNSFWCLLFIDVWFQDQDVWLWYCVFFPLWYKDYLLAKYSLYIVYYLHPSFHLPYWPRTKYMFTFPPQRKKYPVRVEACHCCIHPWSFVRILTGLFPNLFPLSVYSATSNLKRILLAESLHSLNRNWQDWVES